MTTEASETWLSDCRKEAAEMVRLGAWTRKQADAALAYLEANHLQFDYYLTSTEALDLARDLT